MTKKGHIGGECKRTACKKTGAYYQHLLDKRACEENCWYCRSCAMGINPADGIASPGWSILFDIKAGDDLREDAEMLKETIDEAYPKEPCPQCDGTGWIDGTEYPDGSYSTGRDCRCVR